MNMKSEFVDIDDAIKSFDVELHGLEHTSKGENCSFLSEEGKLAINDIAIRFAQIHPDKTTVIVLSDNELSCHIAELIASKIKEAKLLNNVICKLTTEEVNDIVLDMNSFFRKVYKGENAFNTAYFQLCEYLEEMNKKRRGTFSRHFIKDTDMRDIVMNTLKESTNRYARNSNVINGQDILVINDTINMKQTTKYDCQIMTECYAPKSITVQTLQSK